MCLLETVALNFKRFNWDQTRLIRPIFVLFRSCN